MNPTVPQVRRVVETQSAFGLLLREWRTRRRVSQLGLAVEADVSSRHVSFIETGRAQPSREMVLMLARVLDIPLRDRNELLMAAGYAAIYRATDLDAPALEQARRALDFMLRQQEPYPAIVVDCNWTLLKANDGAVRLVEAFTDPDAASEWGGNAMRLMFHPRGFRPHIVNWEAMAAALIQWLHRDVLRRASAPRTTSPSRNCASRHSSRRMRRPKRHRGGWGRGRRRRIRRGYESVARVSGFTTRTDPYRCPSERSSE